MFGSDILDIAIGLIFVYLLASLIVSAATELIAAYLGWRANKLWDGIQNLIDSPNAGTNLAKELYEHPLIKGLSPLRTKYFAFDGLPLVPTPAGPSYIPARAFSTALLSVIQKGQPSVAKVVSSLRTILNTARDPHTSPAEIKDALLSVAAGLPLSSPPSELEMRLLADLHALADKIADTADSPRFAIELLRGFVNNAWDRYLNDIIDQIPGDKLRTALRTLLHDAEGNLEKFKEAIETWFDDAMDRVSGWYKRHVQWVQLILATAVTFALNLDSVSIVTALTKDNSGLLKAVAQAQKFTEQNPAPANSGAAPSSSPSPSPNIQNAAAAAGPSAKATEIRQLLDQFSELNLPIGWTARSCTGDPDFRQWPGWPWERCYSQQWLTDCARIIIHHFLGWLLTVVAVSLGAPFWFDLLSRFVAIRSSGDPTKQASKTKSDANSKKKN